MRLLLFLPVAYIGILALLLALENRLLFAFPDSEEWVAPLDGRVQDLHMSTADATPIHAWWCPPDDWAPDHGALLYCHGNGGNLSRRSGPIAAWQKALRTAVLIFDYPGYGRSGGSPTEAGCYLAADAAYDWLTNTQGVAPRQILLYGESLGGGVATDLASRRPHRALVLDSAFASFPDVAQYHYPYLPARWLVRNRFDNLAKLPRCEGPTFIAHGTADPVAPLAHSQRLFAAARDPKHLLVLEGCGHCQALTEEFFARLKQFLAETEGSSSRGGVR